MAMFQKICGIVVCFLTLAQQSAVICFFPAGGYYCANGSEYLTLCNYPNYCPPNSTEELPCKLGYSALNSSGLRASHRNHCSICPPGTYGNHPQRRFCSECPAGYYCPNGTKSPTANPCPEGFFCPAGAPEPQPCSVGSYGNRERATKASDCFPCPPGTFNNLVSQRACLSCGSSSVSKEGQATCTCLGKSRSFQVSDRSCVCLLRYVFDDDQAEGDSDLDCRPMVSKTQ